jgi:hypothetical protein
MSTLSLSLLALAALSAPAFAQTSVDTIQGQPDKTLGQPRQPMSQTQEPMGQTETMRMDPVRRDALVSQVPSLTPTPAEKARAAAVYMDDALALLNMADAHLQANDARAARVELVAASGKLTDAYLYGFHDRRLSDRLQPLVMRSEDALTAAVGNDLASARQAVASLQPQLASIYSSQLATMGGGAGRGGGGYEPLKRAPLRQPMDQE